MSTNPQLKLISFFVLGVGLPTSAMAFNPAMFNGFYAGAMGGVLQSRADISTSSSALYNTIFTADNEIQTSQSEINLIKYSGVGALYVGYGHFINTCPYYLGGEFFVNWANHNNSFNQYAANVDPVSTLDLDSDDNYQVSLSDSTQVKLRNTEYGFDIRPGFLFDTYSMVYARIGLAFNKMKTTNSSDFAYTNLGNALPVTSHSVLSQTKSKNLTGLRLGLGVEHQLTDKLSLTADYIYTYYGKVNTNEVADSNFANGEDTGNNFLPSVIANGQTSSSSTRISTQAAMIGIKFYFLT